MAFIVTRTLPGNFIVTTLGNQIFVSGEEIDLSESYSLDELNINTELIAAISNADLVRLDGFGGSPIPPSEAFGDSNLSDHIDQDFPHHPHSNKAVIDAINSAGDGNIITAFERSKLSGIEAGAQVNDTGAEIVVKLTGEPQPIPISVDQVDGRDASFLLDRTNHTGTQSAGTLSDLDGYIDSNLSTKYDQPNGIPQLDANGTLPTSKITDFATDVDAQIASKYNQPSGIPQADLNGTLPVNRITNFSGETTSVVATLYDQPNGIPQADSNGTLPTSKITNFDGYVDARITAKYDQPNGIPQADANGTLPTSKITDFSSEVTTISNSSITALYDQPNGIPQADASGTLPTSKITNFDGYVDARITAKYDQPNGIPQADANGTLPTSKITDFDGYVDARITSKYNQANGIPQADANGTLPVANITDFSSEVNTRADARIANAYDQPNGIPQLNASGLLDTAKIDGFSAAVLADVASLYDQPNGIPQADASGTLPTSKITNFNGDVDARISLQSGAAGGFAPLDVSLKIPVSFLPDAALSGLDYQGTWDASTNTPTIVSGTGTTGDFYIVSVAGSSNIDGETNWAKGDWVVFNGTAWERVPVGAIYVISINGILPDANGNVTLTTSDISEGTNLYYTEARVTANASVTANTAKVSADGSIDTHSDVDTTTTPPSNGQVLSYDGASWVPADSTTSNAFTIFSIWAEENSTLGNGSYEWSFGNGDEVNQGSGIPIPIDCDIFALSFEATTAGGANTIVEAQLNGISAASITVAGNQNSGFTSISPVSVSAGDVLGFRTVTAGSAASARISAWFRVTASSVSTAVLSDLLDVSGTLPSTGEALVWDGSIWAPGPAGAVDSVNGQSGTVVLDTDDVGEGLTNLYYTEARVNANASVAANTAKISADGSVNTHSDVDTTTTPPSNGQALVWDGTNWVPGQAGAVDSVNGETGVVVLDTDDIGEGLTNLYYTEGRVSANASVVANTAKVSADGSVGTHSDVNLTGISNGEVLVWNGSAFDPGAFPTVPVQSVNGQTGVVVLGAADVGADIAGSAAGVQTNLTTHINDTANPHATSIANIGSGTLAELNLAISDADIKIPSNRIVVAKSGGDYSDISDAVAQAVATATAANPVTVQIYPGDYSETTSVQVSTNDYITIEGIGEAILNSTANPGIDISSPTSIRNLTIKSSNTTGSAIRISGAGMSRASIEDIVTDGFERGISLESTLASDSKVFVRSSIINNFNIYGILSDGAGQCYIYDSKFAENTSSPSFTRGIFAAGSGKVFVSDCTFNNNISAAIQTQGNSSFVEVNGGTAIGVATGFDSSTGGTLVLNNFSFIDTTSNAINVSGSVSTVTDLTINNCIFDTTSVGINLASHTGTANLKIYNNIFKGSNPAVRVLSDNWLVSAGSNSFFDVITSYSLTLAPNAKIYSNGDSLRLGTVFGANPTNFIHTGVDDNTDKQSLHFNGVGSVPLGTIADGEFLTYSGGEIVSTTSPGGISESDHRSLRQFVHLAGADGPGLGFATGAFLEKLPVGSPFPTSYIWYESAAKTEKILEITVTRNAQKRPTQVVYEIYNADGSTVEETITDTPAYTSGVISSETRTIA